MTADAAVKLSLLVSIWLIVLSLGLRASLASLGAVLGRPAASLRAFVALFLAVPAFAILLAETAPVPAPIRFAIVALAAAPVAPILPYKQMKAGGDADYAVGLVVAAAVASMVVTPILIEVASRLLQTEAAVTVAQVTQVLLISIAAPLGAGMLLRASAPRLAGAIQEWVQRAGRVLLLLTFVALVVTLWSEMGALLGGGGALAIAGLVAAGLLAGHLLGGRDSGALALAAASRHPGVALAIGDMSFPHAQKPIMAAVILALFINALVTAPYVRWMAGRSASNASGLSRPAAPRST
jgi:BASS family bile acid:Na+ symporter